ncbi:phorbol esters/diacylglycerol binding domain protein [Trichuris suis]|nr:phorbol esters/diacylglycerol binding domain protein [Trichuris suis]
MYAKSLFWDFEIEPSLYKSQSRELKDELVCKDQELNSVKLHLNRQSQMLRDQQEADRSARRIAEDSLSDVEKARAMLEIEMKQLINRHKQEITGKEATIDTVVYIYAHLAPKWPTRFQLKEKEAMYLKNIEDLRKAQESLNVDLESANKELSRKTSMSTSTDEQIQQLKKLLEKEQQLKKSAIDKLTEVMQMKSTSAGKKGSRADELKRKDREFKKLQQDLQQEKRKYDVMVTRFQKEISDLQASLYEEGQSKLRMMLELECKEEELELVQQKLHTLLSETCSVDSASMAGDAVDFSNGDSLEHRLESSVWIPHKVSAKKKGWKKHYAVLFNRKIYIYANEADKQTSNASLILDVEKFYHVRHVTNADVRFAEEKEIPRIFQIIYAGEGESRLVGEVQPTESPNPWQDVMSHKGHDFIAISFHSPTSCDICSKQLWNVLKPPPALECKSTTIDRCHVKIHKDHLEKHDKDVAPCRVNYDPMLARDLLVMVSSADDCKVWVSRLRRCLENCRKSSDAKTSRSSGSSSHK